MALVDALSKPEGRRNQALVDSIRRQIIETEEKLADIASRLEREFPDYAALATTKPLKAEVAQALLHPEEALVLLA